MAALYLYFWRGSIVMAGDGPTLESDRPCSQPSVSMDCWTFSASSLTSLSYSVLSDIVRDNSLSNEQWGVADTRSTKNLALRSAQQGGSLLLLLSFLSLLLKCEPSIFAVPPLPQTSLKAGLSTSVLSQRNSFLPKMEFPGDVIRETEAVVYITHPRTSVWNPLLTSFFSWV